MSEFRKVREVPTKVIKNPNISTENQPEGAARRPGDTLDREPARDPESGGSVEGPRAVLDELHVLDPWTQMHARSGAH